VSNDTAKTPAFSREMTFKYGALERVAPGLRRIVCPNPGAFTFKGTNLYVVGEGRVAVIDPGPSGKDQLDVLMADLGPETITHIVLTHSHADHSGAVAELKARTGAITCGMLRTAPPASKSPSPSGGGYIVSVEYDMPLVDGAIIAGDGWTLEALHTPGHAPVHLCFQLVGQNALLSGDHVMGWNTSVVAPPEGHMGSYMRALERLLEREEATYFPAHGGPILEPQRFVRALIFHRRWRENEILDSLRQGATVIADMVPRIYPSIEPALSAAAAMSIFAHLEYLVERGIVATSDGGKPAMNKTFVLT
jgi:glyoxylase-like metal-dependent hydrolase (beta-lactamase superfamily II)